jgi:hypothetical protein
MTKKNYFINRNLTHQFERILLSYLTKGYRSIMFMRSYKNVTYIKAQGIVMYLVCDKEYKIEDDCSNYEKKNSSRNIEVHIVRK